MKVKIKTIQLLSGIKYLQEKQLEILEITVCEELGIVRYGIISKIIHNACKIYFNTQKQTK